MDELDRAINEGFKLFSEYSDSEGFSKAVEYLREYISHNDLIKEQMNGNLLDSQNVYQLKYVSDMLLRSKVFYSFEIKKDVEIGFWNDLYNKIKKINIDTYESVLYENVKQHLSNINISENDLLDICLVSRSYVNKILLDACSLNYFWRIEDCTMHKNMQNKYGDCYYDISDDTLFYNEKTYLWEKRDCCDYGFPGAAGYLCKCKAIPVVFIQKSEKEIADEKKRREEIDNIVINKRIVSKFINDNYNVIRDLNHSSNEYKNIRNEIMNLDVSNYKWITIGYIYYYRCIEYLLSGNEEQYNFNYLLMKEILGKKEIFKQCQLNIENIKNRNNC